jgi:hypothetical protein
MELQRVDSALHIRHRGKRRVRGRGDRLETRRQLFDAIAVAHPHFQVRARPGEPVQQRVFIRELHLGVAVLTVIGALDRTAELRGERLHAVADAEHRRRRGEDRVADLRRAGGAYRLRTARQDDAGGRYLRDLLRASVVRQDLAVDADFANAPRDELRVLPAEVDDEDAGGVGCFHAGLARDGGA